MDTLTTTIRTIAERTGTHPTVLGKHIQRISIKSDYSQSEVAQAINQYLDEGLSLKVALTTAYINCTTWSQLYLDEKRLEVNNQDINALVSQMLGRKIEIAEYDQENTLDGDRLTVIWLISDPPPDLNDLYNLRDTLDEITPQVTHSFIWYTWDADIAHTHTFP